MKYSTIELNEYAKVVRKKVDLQLEGVIARALTDLCDKELFDAEKNFLDAMMGIFRTILGEALAITDEKLTRERKAGTYVKSIEKRQQMFTFGMVRFNRRRIYDPSREKGARYTYPLDELIGLPRGDKFSPLLKAQYATAASEGAYRATIATQSLYIGWKCSPASIQNFTDLVSKLVKAENYEDSEQYWNQMNAIGDFKSEKIFVEADGVWIPKQRSQEEKKKDAAKALKAKKNPPKRKKFESKIGKAYNGKSQINKTVEVTDKKTDKPTARYQCNNVVIHATTGSIDDFWAGFMGKTMSKYDYRTIKGGQLGTDGDPKYKNGLDYLGDGFKNSLDPYHVYAKINKHISDDKAAASIENMIRENNNILKATEDVKRLIEKETNPKETKKLKELYTYFMNNWETIDTSLESLGTMEATNSHIVGDRLKAQGGGWSIHGANNILQIRAQRASEIPLPKITRDNKIVGNAPVFKRKKVLVKGRTPKHNPDKYDAVTDVTISDAKLNAIVRG
jgi:hypothetical protein